MLQGLLIKKIMEIVNKKVGKESQDLRNKIEESIWRLKQKK